MVNVYNLRTFRSILFSTLGSQGLFLVRRRDRREPRDGGVPKGTSGATQGVGTPKGTSGGTHGGMGWGTEEDVRQDRKDSGGGVPERTSDHRQESRSGRGAGFQ